MKDKLVSKRLKVNWKYVIDRLEDFTLNRDFWVLRSKSHVSDNRLAYVVLRRYYSKKILDYYRHSGDICCFNIDFDFDRKRIVIN